VLYINTYIHKITTIFKFFKRRIKIKKKKTKKKIQGIESFTIFVLSINNLKIEIMSLDTRDLIEERENNQQTEGNLLEENVK
jgi:hypothetical protein